MDSIPPTSSMRADILSNSSDHVSDTEENEISDDDDDDRNHKHRRRENRSQSFDKDTVDHFRRFNRKRNPSNGTFLEDIHQHNEIQKEHNFQLKFERKRPALAPLPQPHSSSDFSQKMRIGQTSRNDSVSLSIGKGRGWHSGSWNHPNQHESRFGSVDPINFAPQLSSQVPSATNIFTGRALPNVATSNIFTGNAFGLFPGMPNGGLETIHSLGLQSALLPPINPSLNIGMSLQRCKDFDERGFCLRGDMCPMDHGVNRIVVEDVQSLSQFNLPVSIPTTRSSGNTSGHGLLSASGTASGVLSVSKRLSSKSEKFGGTDNGLGFTGLLSATEGAGDADVYDPDQPLWNNGQPEKSNAFLMRSPSKMVEELPLWEADESEPCNLRSSTEIDDQRQRKRNLKNGGPYGPTPSSWSSRNRAENSSNIKSTGNGSKEISKGNLSELVDVGPNTEKFITSISGQNVGKAHQKAQRTVFVNGIPLENNRKEILLSHFKKFGQIIDIHIPMNSEKAFIQYSRREEAEAALKSPDAVLGNRFIKLWWANRDRILDHVEIVDRGTISSVSVSASSPTSTNLKEKEVLASVTEKMPAVTQSDPSSIAVTNGPKPLSSQKKLETLELLKEELRKKQEMLEQKRKEVYHRLDKLGKHTNKEPGSEQPSKRQTTDNQHEAKHTSPGSGVLVALEKPEVEKSLDRTKSGECIASPKSLQAILPHSPKPSLKAINRPILNGSSFMANRFKLDNRPTAFRILPPLPDGLANVAALKDHFSSFSDLSNVELEDSVDLRPSSSCAACITFTTRRSAEKAFMHGKSWQGHQLHFIWVSPSSNNSKENVGKGCSQLTPTHNSMEKNAPSSAFLREESSTSADISQNTVAKSKEDTEDVKDSDGGVSQCHPPEKGETTQTSPSVSSCQQGSPKSDIES